MRHLNLLYYKEKYIYMLLHKMFEWKKTSFFQETLNGHLPCVRYWDPGDMKSSQPRAILSSTGATSPWGCWGLERQLTWNEMCCKCKTHWIDLISLSIKTNIHWTWTRCPLSLSSLWSREERQTLNKWPQVHEFYKGAVECPMETQKRGNKSSLGGQGKASLTRNIWAETQRMSRS